MFGVVTRNCVATQGKERGVRKNMFEQGEQAIFGGHVGLLHDAGAQDVQRRDAKSQEGIFLGVFNRETAATGAGWEFIAAF